jgi:uncharacterized membrane protein YebE (DUF533 family)
MFNPEKMLGGLIRSGMRGRGLGGMVSGGAALGLVGVAMEAVEHFMNRPQASPQTAPAGSPPPAPGVAAPPPPPLYRPSPPPPAFRGGDLPAADPETGNDAVLLIRAMIAAANADGVIDAQERTHILEKLKTVELSDDEHQFIVHELLGPRDMQDIIDAVKTDPMARQVYTVSLLAIEVDTDQEKTYLRSLAANLGLDSAAINDIHQQFGIPLP